MAGPTERRLANQVLRMRKKERKFMITKHFLFVGAITFAACSHERSEPKSPETMTPASDSAPTGREYQTPPAATPLSGRRAPSAGVDANPRRNEFERHYGRNDPSGSKDEIRSPNSDPYPLGSGSGGVGGSGGGGGSTKRWDQRRRQRRARRLYREVTERKRTRVSLHRAR